MIYTITLNPARDRSVIINDFSAGKVNRIVSMKDFPGGKGINVSKIVHELGGKTTSMGIVGGASGDFIKTSLDELGIDHDFVISANETRTNIKISDPVNHTTTDINDSGAPLTRELAYSVLDKLLSVVNEGDSVVIAGKTDTKAVDLSEWITRLNQAGARVFLDTEGEALKAGAAASPFMLKPNDNEMEALCGRKPVSTEDIINCAREVLSSCGIGIILVSRGAKGAVCVTKESIMLCEGVSVDEVCTTGAGDTMLGAFAAALENGDTVSEAFAISVAAGAAAVTMPGTECPSNVRINELLKQVEVKVL